MEPHNPALSRGTFARFAAGAIPREDAMTFQGTLNKSLGMVILALISGAVSWALIDTSPSVGYPLMALGGIGGFVLAMVTIFKQDAARITAPIYAVCEGLVLGAISLLYGQQYQGIVPQAIGLTIAVMLLMLGLYRAGLLRATPLFTRMVVIATGAIALTYFIDVLAMMLFRAQLPFIATPTPIGIGIQLLIVGVAALNFVIDFDFIDKGAQQGAPKYMEWYGAFSICLTLFWLYLEILRLLTLLSDSRR